MAYPFDNDPSQFTPYTNPAGDTYQIPNQFAGSFNLPPPPAAGPLPTFDPAELAPPPPPEPVAPVPSAFTPMPLPTPPVVTPEEQAQLPAPQPMPQRAPAP